MAIEFKLIPEKVPKSVKAGSRYDAIIDKFYESDISSARVDTESMEAKTLALGLRTRLRSREDITGIKVSQRRDKVYLFRE